MQNLESNTPNVIRHLKPTSVTTKTEVIIIIIIIIIITQTIHRYIHKNIPIVTRKVFFVQSLLL